jgi:acyl-CoA synthetase (AMP-forming)/AMP-acid ligase II
MTLPELFAAQVARTPDADAVVFEDERLSYGDPDARSSQLARHLRGLRGRSRGGGGAVTSPSIRQDLTLRWFTASRISGKRSDQSLPRRVISRMPTESLRAIRCLISWIPFAPDGGRSAGDGKQGSMKRITTGIAAGYI